MKVRCGSCSTEFDVPGPGRFGCPTCGTVNSVGGGAAPPPPEGPLGDAGAGSDPPPAPAPPAIDVSEVRCGECSFSFLVGEVATAPCPNCGAEVDVGGVA